MPKLVNVKNYFYPKNAFVFISVYLRQEPSFEMLGLVFDVYETKANDTFNYWLDDLGVTRKTIFSHDNIKATQFLSNH